MGPSTPNWAPGASIAALAARAELLALVREFFRQRQVLEVETPLLAQAGPTDPLLASVAVPIEGTRYLQTSPEFAMKRLLAAGSGPIYQICKAFRAGENGSRHNVEFTMLEWYRPGFTLAQLIDEVQALVSAALPAVPVQQLSYGDLVAAQLGFNPHCASLQQLQQAGAAANLGEWPELDSDQWLDLLMGMVIEPALPQGLVFVHSYPASQAALSRVAPDASGQPVAQRFELYINGMEVANGYDELLDADELRARMQADNARRQQLGLPIMPTDERLLAAMQHGLPAMSGVALGLDRLLLQQQGLQRLEQVLAFTFEQA